MRKIKFDNVRRSRTAFVWIKNNFKIEVFRCGRVIYFTDSVCQSDFDYLVNCYV